MRQRALGETLTVSEAVSFGLTVAVNVTFRTAAPAEAVSTRNTTVKTARGSRIAKIIRVPTPPWQG